MLLKKEYEKFYQGVKESKRIVNRKYYEKISFIIDNLKSEGNIYDDLDNLKDEISSIKSIKEHYVAVYNKFVKYLKKNKYNVLYDDREIYKKSTRLIELIKFFQIPRTNDDVLETFCIGEKTLKKDKKEIEKGIDFLGYKLKVKLSKYNRNGNNTIDEEKFQSSCNPIGLALNMTELYMLTNLIPNKIKNDEFLFEQYNEFIQKINSQLTDYAADIMKVDNTADIIEMYTNENNFLKQNVRKQLFYVLKRDKKCTFIYSNKGEYKEVIGKVYDIPNEYISIQNENGEVIKIDYIDYIGIKFFFEEIYE